jgi:DNA polymerase III delta subunit
MLYVFIGSDQKTSAEKARVCVNRLLEREPFATRVSLNSETIGDANIGDILATQGLFKDKMIITLNGVFSSSEAEQYSAHVQRFAESEHIVIVIDSELKATEKNTLKKHAHTLVESSLKAVQSQTYNPFALADALYARDAKQLFTRIEEARLRGDEIESVVGLLLWSAKAMYIAAQSESPASSGLKPFVYNKARTGAKQWGGALSELVRELAYVLHRARTQGRDGYEELERTMMRLCA